MRWGRGDRGLQHIAGPCTSFVSGFKTNPVDAAFLNSHMVRAMDYNDIYWKADPCHPSDIICGPLVRVVDRLPRPDPGDVIAYEVEHAVRVRRPDPRVRVAPRDADGVCAAGGGAVLGLSVDQMAGRWHCGSRTFTPGAVTAGKPTNMKNTVTRATRMGVESALLATRVHRPST